MAPTDPHYGRYGSVDAPASRAQAITLSDSNDLPIVTRAIYVGTGGTVVVTMVTGDQVTFVGVPVGTILPIAASRVWNTGTTASNLVALW